MEALERDAIIKALRDADGNRVQAETTRGIARSSLYRKLKSFGITTIERGFGAICELTAYNRLPGLNCF
jgi:DNA-binding NtrC family response regulator